MNENSLEIWRILMEKGTAHLGQEEYRNAEKFFLQSLKVANELDVPEIKAFNLRLLATAQIKQGKIETAERGFREALRICEGISNAKGMAEALAGLASVAVAVNNPEKAILQFKRAIEVYPETSPQLRLAMLYSDLGQVYAALERWQEAMDTYEYARKLCHQYEYPKGVGELSVLIGEACYRLENKKEARRELISAGKIFTQIGESNSLVNALQYLAFMDFEQEKYEEARASLQRAIVLQIQEERWDEVCETSYFLAKILQGLALLDETALYLNLTLRLYNQKDIGFALRLQSMGKLLLVKQEYSIAKEYFKEAADLFEYFGEDLRLGECYENLAYCADSLGEEEEAVRYRKEFKRTVPGHHAISLSAVHRLAEYYEERHKYLNALQCYWQSLQIAREIGYETKEIEKAVQRVSKRVRKKK